MRERFKDFAIVLAAMPVYLPPLLLLHRHVGGVGSLFLTLLVVVPLARTG